MTLLLLPTVWKVNRWALHLLPSQPLATGIAIGVKLHLAPVDAQPFTSFAI